MLSTATHTGVTDVLRATMAAIDAGRARESSAAGGEAQPWTPV